MSHITGTQRRIIDVMKTIQPPAGRCGLTRRRIAVALGWKSEGAVYNQLLVMVENGLVSIARYGSGHAVPGGIFLTEKGRTI